VGPVFPPYFALQTTCAAVALATALSWWNADGGRRVHRWRVIVLALGVLTAVASLPIATQVSDLRLLRFSTNTDVARAAKEAFGQWHFASLLLSFVSVVLAGIALA